jgi:hypothetical protein
VHLVAIFLKKPKRIFGTSLMLFCLLWQFNSYASTQTALLSLFEAEHLAIDNAPELQRLRANTGALEEQAVADGQLSDQQLIVGAANVPTNSFSFTQDDMTMVNVGLQRVTVKCCVQRKFSLGGSSFVH